MSRRKARVFVLLVLVAALGILHSEPARADYCLGWGWFENCCYCEGPTYEMICDTRCFYCPDTGVTTCEPTGWTCGGSGNTCL
jgi:hypothetical protein